MSRNQGDSGPGPRPRTKRESVSTTEVANFLRQHPGFLEDNPELLEHLTPPARWTGDGIVDMNHYILDRLRGEVDNLRSCAMDLIDTVRTNLSGQTRTHSAVLALVAADGLDHLVRTVRDHLPLILDVDAVALGFEPPSAPIPALVGPDFQRLPKGCIRRLIGAGERVQLVGEMNDDGTVFGAAAGLVRSAALARIRPDEAMPAGLFALGSRTEDAFHSGQGPELVQFLARVVENRLQRFLGPPA